VDASRLETSMKFQDNRLLSSARESSNPTNPRRRRRRRRRRFHDFPKASTPHLTTHAHTQRAEQSIHSFPSSYFIHSA
jgi:hypothetical protein